MKRAEVLKILFVLFLNLVYINATAANRKMEIVPEKLHPFNKTALKYRGDFPWDTYCEDFNVEDGTFFPHPDECNWYILCWNNELFVEACEEGEVFNRHTSYCDSPDNYDCVLGLYPPMIYPDCLPPGSGEIVVLPSLFCESFYICIDGWPIEMQCRPGQHWNAERSYCDNPRDAGCEIGNHPQELPDCPIAFTGNLPHPDDCNLYIHCSNGNRFIQRCSHLFNFDIATAQCTIRTQATCIDEYRGRRRG